MTWFGPGVMQSAQGEPACIVPLAVGLLTGLGPIAGLALGSKGTSMVIWRTKLPSPSNTWIRRLPRSATYTLPLASTAMLWGTLNSPGLSPGPPQDVSQLPFLSALATREFM